MLIFNNKADLRSLLSRYISKGSSIGFVPTMGALHRGHLSLLEQSVKDNDITVISIFVNPTQFNNPEDLKKYPRTLEVDVAQIETVSRDIIVFAPSVDEMYDGNTQSVSFSFDGLENQMEGSHRPGHFDGVGTIVKKLFEYVQPTNAYFGEKDFQQLQIVKKLVAKNNIPVNIVGCPITREPNGLAMSSRNQRLTDAEKETASLIYKTLTAAKDQFAAKTIEEVKEYVTQSFSAHPEFKLEYFEITAEDDLIPTTLKENKKYRAFIAVMLSNVRLIDNISLN
ncbi:pantoate--beta-alanine ligase [Flavobacterium salilacus subsp. salilacus]|uniref:pantoate--beta-alanine ligase n=1 Tax=Flavobacterium TaxID=237 RepID=UPI0010751FB5|nr:MULTISPECIES: pantoate--beta-alanine ligase [Flavobacterium]KAF2518864.1 pantoate--beta-alanine ligase [Flavobacterium salilacus subsp. salilacus]MBE1614976.1 pantoate--beta-alanine ligase [Flavobacterium sp. SaA2.13]